MERVTRTKETQVCFWGKRERERKDPRSACFLTFERGARRRTSTRETEKEEGGDGGREAEAHEDDAVSELDSDGWIGSYRDGLDPDGAKERNERKR